MKIRRSRTVAVLDSICFVALACATAMLVIYWDRISGTLPPSGKAGRIGTKGEILILAILAWIIYIAVTVAERFPKIWNTGVKVTEENRERVYSALYYAISTEKLIVTWIFILLIAQTALPAGAISPWIMQVSFIIAAADLIYWLRRVASL